MTEHINELFSFFDKSLLHILAPFCLRSLLREFQIWNIWINDAVISPEDTMMNEWIRSPTLKKLRWWPYSGMPKWSPWSSVYPKLEPWFLCGGGDFLALPVKLTASEPKTGRRAHLDLCQVFSTVVVSQADHVILLLMSLELCGTATMNGSPLKTNSLWSQKCDIYPPKTSVTFLWWNRTHIATKNQYACFESD